MADTRFSSRQDELAVPAGEVELETDMNIYGVHELPVRWTETAQ
ncbi:hypothetical protein [Nocardia colli]